MDCFVLDTSLFTNPDVYGQFGPDTQQAIAAFLKSAKRTALKFYIPTSVYDELRKMKDLSALAGDFEAGVIVRSPRKYNLMVPSELLYELIEEVRHRIDRGLRVAEELTKLAGAGPHTTDTGPLITKLRERYREVLRRGILDSKEDADCLLLAYELDGVMVSGDEGLRKWADKVGIKIIEPRNLSRILDNLASR
jgi:RNA ligase partner protein